MRRGPVRHAHLANLPAPDARLSVAQLGRVFVPYRPHGRMVELRNRYVLVLPIQPRIPSRLEVRPT